MKNRFTTTDSPPRGLVPFQLLRWAVLPVLLVVLNQTVFAQGYIYVHKSTLNEESSTNFPFTVSGGPTAISTFNLNDSPTNNDAQDLGAGGDRLWAVAGGAVFYRVLGSAAWASTTATGVVAVDGGPNDDAVIANGTDVYLTTNGGTFNVVSGASAPSDVAFDKGSNNLIYRSGSTTGIYWKPAGSGAWARIGGFTATRVDYSPTGDPIRYIGTDNNVYSLTYGGASTFIGRPATASVLTDIAVDDNGVMYIQTGQQTVFRYTGSAWVEEVTSRGGQNITGGQGGQVWEVQTNTPASTKTIWTRTAGGIWIDDERVRTSPNSNSAMFTVTAGTYTFTESTVASWALQDVIIYDPTNNSTSSVSGRTATINVANGEVVHVIFQNGLTQSSVVSSNCGTNFSDDFGTGTAGTAGPVQTGLTSYHWQNALAGDVKDGYYKVINRSQDAGYGFSAGYQDLNDHTTGAGTGRYLFINANYQKDVFYRRRFTGLIVGLQYSLKYWVMNVTGNTSLGPRVAIGGTTILIPPNVQASITDPTTGGVLSTNSTGDLTTLGVWQQQTLTFTATQANIDLFLSNNSIGGQGNDLGIDDITFGLASAAPPVVVVTNAGCSTPGSLSITSPLGSVYEYSIDGTNYQTSPTFASVSPGSYSVTARYTGTTGCSSTATTATVTLVCAITISGTVFNDPDGGTIDGTPTNVVAGNTFYVSTVNPTTGAVISTTAVQPDGTYSLTASPSTSYSVVLSTAPQTVGTPVSATVLTGAANTAEGTAPTGDGTPDGKTPVTTATTSVTGVNFGIDPLPTAGSGTNQVPNFGGTTPVTVPNTAFNNTTPTTDTAPGSVTAIRITAFPSNVTSLTINGVTYTAASPQFTGGTPTGVTIPTDGSGNPTVAIAVDPTNDANPISIPYKAIDNAGKESANTGSAQLTFPTLFSLTGTVLDDGNGLTDGIVNTSGSTPVNPVNGTSLDGSPLYATLVNSGGTAVTTVPVTSVGSYTFTGVPAGTYSVVLSTNPAGSLTASLPTSWTNTGENVGTGTGNDGTPNGILTNIVVAANVTDANFGIDKQPTVSPVTVASQPNPGGTTAAPVPSTAFTGTDPEDGTYPTNLTGRTVTLTPATNGTLFYNGSPVNSTTAITTFNPALVTLDPTAPGATTGSDPTFTYSVTDNAGVPSSPATVTVPFSAPTAITLSGTVFNDTDGGTIDGTPVNTLGGNTFYVSTTDPVTGNVIATTPVAVGGTYSLTASPTTSYSVVLSNAPQTVGSPVSATLLTSVANTGEGTAPTGDGTPNGKTPVTTATSPVTGINFGVKAQPAFACTDGVSYMITGNPSALSTVDLKTGILTQIASAATLGNRNLTGMGYNPVDNYLYASVSGTSDIVRIASDGTTQLLTVPNLPAGVYGAGDVGPTGIMYLYTTIATTMYKVDLTTLPLSATAMTVGAANVGDISITPNGQNILAMSANSGNVLAWPIAGGALSVNASVGNSALTAATFMDKTGDLFFIDAANSRTYEVPGPLSGVANSSTQRSPDNNTALTNTDGARCLTSSATPAQSAFACTPNQAFISTMSTLVSNADCSVLPGKSTLLEYDLSTGTIVATSAQLISDFNGRTSINNLGYNPTDNYLWAYRLGTNQMVRIGQDRSIEFFAIPGLSNACPNNTTPNNSIMIAGDVDVNGVMYLFNGNEGDRLVRVDLNPSSPTYLTKLSDVALTPITPSAKTLSPIPDLAISPIDGQLYNISQNNNLIRINPTTGVVTNVGAVTGLPAVVATTSYVVAFFDNAGSLYVQRASDPNIYQVKNVSSGGLVATRFSAGVSIVGGDGARCPNSTITSVLPIIAGNILDDGNGLTDGIVNTFGASALNPINGTSLDGVPIYVSLVSSGTVIGVAAVSPTGSYTFTGIAPGTYSVVLSTTSSGGLTATLPTSWTSTGENIGTGTGSDGTPNGILTNIVVTTTDVTNANLGIEKKPVVVAATDTPRANPGGTTPSPVTSTVFSGSDQEDGTYPTNLSGRTVTLTPATNGTLYYNGTPVNSTTAITGFNPALVSLDPNALGATTGTAGASPDPTFTYSVTDNAGFPSTPQVVRVPFTAVAALPTLSGNVFDDGNGLTDGVVSTTGTTPLNPVNGTSLDGTPIYATLVNSGGTAIQTVPVTATGGYSFTGVNPGTYSVVLSTNPAGSLTPSLPTSWTNVGEHLGTGAGSDGTPNGILTNVVVGGTNVTDANFGIDKAPVVVAATDTPRANPGGNLTTPVSSTVFSGTDPEDGTYPTNLTGRTVTLTPAANGTLFYNGTPVTSTTTITTFNPTLVSLDPTAPGATTGNDPTFTYAVTDNAGVPSLPATVTVPFTAPLLLSGTVFSDPNGLTNSLIDGTPTNTVAGNTFYVSTTDPLTGNVISTTAVAGDGTYSLPVTANTSYSVVLSNAPQTVGSPVSATLLTGAVNTGEGTAPAGDGTPNGKTPVSVVTTSVTGVNFGVEVPPTATSSTLASQPNPGGTLPIVVPPASFTGTDPDGTLTNVIYTSFPTGVTSVTIAGNPYTAGTFPPTGVTATVGSPVSVDPTDPATSVVIPFQVVDNAGKPSSNTATVTIPLTTLPTLSGNVLSDGNGLTDGTVNHIGSGPSPVDGTDVDPLTAGSQPVYATLVNSGGTAVATVPVTAAGSYTFVSVPAGTYSVVLSTNPSGSLTSSLPTSLTNVGENLGTGSGSDGPANGILTGITVASTDVVNANFGIDQRPVGAPITVASQPNPGGTVAAPVPSTAFTGTDLEDGTYPANLNGRTVTLTPGVNGTLYYNSTPVTSATTLTGFNPALVTLDPTALGATTGADPTFTYSVLDNAGVPSVPATVTVPFTAGLPTLSGNVLNDGNGLNDNTVNTSGTGALGTVNGTSLDGSPLYATLVTSGGTAVATVPVTTAGSYTFVSVPAGTYSVVLSTNPAGSLTPSLPTSWTNTGENLGTGTGNDGLPNGILTSIVVGASDVTEANFGIDKKPMVNPITVAAQPNPGGAIAAPVPATAFTGSDSEDGTYPNNLTGREVTLSPATNGTLFYDGTPVTSTTAITGFNPALVTLDPTAPGATTGNDPTFTYTVKDNAGMISAPATVTVPFTSALVSLSGSVLNDGNGLTDGTVNTFGASALSPLNGTDIDPAVGGSQPVYATLVDNTSTAVATVPVTAAGTYSFPGVAPGTYSVVLSTNPAGSLIPSLPASWTNVGEHLGTGAGSDGPANGILTGIVVAASPVTDANFGIDQAPVVSSITLAAQPNPGGTAQAPVSSTAFTGSDLEEGTYPTNLTGRTVTLSPATNGTLFYNGSPVTSTTTITGFNPALVSLDPTATGATTGSGGASPDPTFTYAVSDNAGVVSAPATVTVPFTAPVPDVAPIIHALPSTQYGLTNTTVVVDVYELNSVATSGLITVYVSKDPLVSLTFNPAATFVGGRPVQNSIWTLTSNADSYIFTTTQVISGGGKRSLGLTGVINPNNTQGTLTLSSTVVGGSGGEVRIDNNSDAEKIDYFKK